MAFTDFPNGLASANDYLTDNIGASAQLSTSVANIAGFMVSAEIDVNLKEIICSLLAGRGLLLPNIQICVSLNIKELLGTVLGTVSDALYAALASLDQAFDKFMDHLKLDEVLGRINNVIAEVTNIANMINFCSAPINPIRIPNVLENVMDSFLGAGRDIVDSIGQVLPGEIGGCLIGGSFNGSIFSSGVLKKVWDNIDDLGAIEQTLINDITLIETAIDDIIARETNVATNYDQGGSDLSEDTRPTHEGVACGFNSQDEGMQGCVSAAVRLKNIYDNCGSYPVVDSNGNTYNNILELICDDDLLRVLRRITDPEPTIAEQNPVYNYCGEIIGYTQTVTQQAEQVSVGTVPETIDQPGYDNGGLPTNPVNAAIAEGEAAGGGTVNTTVTNNYTLDGATLFVGDETGLINSGAFEGRLVYRSDNGVTYLKNNINTGAIIDDYEVVGGGSTFGSFLTDVNASTGNGFLVRSGDTALYRSISGTSGQITVANGSGTGNNPTLSITTNPVLPGTDSVTLTKGTTAQRLSTTNGAMRYNTTTGAFEGYQLGVWQTFATGSGSVNDGLNVGGGPYEVYKQNNVGKLEFRTFNVSGAITMGVAADVITVGESLTASSLGAGSDVFKQRTVNDFEFRSLTAGDGIILTENANDIEVGVISPGFQGTTNTTTAAAAEVLFDGGRQTPASGSLWFVTVTAVANRSDAADATAIKIEGLVDNNSGTVTIVGTAGNKTVYNSTASTSNYDLLLDITANQFRVQVQGDTGHTVDWRVKLDYIESP